MGSKDRKLKAGSSSSKPLSSCVAKGQPMCSPEESRQRKKPSHDTAGTRSELLPTPSDVKSINSEADTAVCSLITSRADVLSSKYYMSADWKCTVYPSSVDKLTAGASQNRGRTSYSQHLKRSFLLVGPRSVLLSLSCLICLHTIRIRLTLLSAVEVGQQVAGATLQVRAQEVAVQVGEKLVQAVVVGRAPEVLRVLVQPRAQDGRDGAAAQGERCHERSQIAVKIKGKKSPFRTQTRGPDEKSKTD